nr:MAG TPA: hypothetical protein [Caudoviricetes sp.]
MQILLTPSLYVKLLLLQNLLAGKYKLQDEHLYKYPFSVCILFFFLILIVILRFLRTCIRYSLYYHLNC